MAVMPLYRSATVRFAYFPHEIALLVGLYRPYWLSGEPLRRIFITILATNHPSGGESIACIKDDILRDRNLVQSGFVVNYLHVRGGLRHQIREADRTKIHDW
jgi:hypothetical protein